MHDFHPILQVLVSLIPVEMGECAVHRIQPTIHVVVLLVSLVQTAAQTSTSVHLVPVLTVGHASKAMGWQLAVFVLKDLMAQDVTLIFHSAGLTCVLMVVHAWKDLGPLQLVTVFLVSLVPTAVQTSTSVHLAPVLMVVHALKGMGQKHHACVPKISVDLNVQPAFLVSCLHIDKI